MSMSPKTRPSNPSSGTAPNHRRCPGRRSSSAGTDISSQIPPSVLAVGETTFSERNKRTPIATEKIGSRNAPMPKNCKSRSAPSAPTMPTQFRATREPVRTEALFSEGSSGEYDASARKRRSAETHKRNPSNSLSRRLLVGLKMRPMNFIMAWAVWQSPCGAGALARDSCYRHAAQRQSQIIITRGMPKGNDQFGTGSVSFLCRVAKHLARTPERQAQRSTEEDQGRSPRVALLPRYRPVHLSGLSQLTLHEP